MSDRTSMRGHLYSVPKGQARKVAKLFNEYGISTDAFIEGRPWTSWDAARIREFLAIQEEPFGDDEWRCGDTNDFAKQLAARGVVFQVYESPKYEWLGELYMHHPELGMFFALCDDEGGPLFTVRDYHEIVKVYGATTSAVIKIGAKLGVFYEKAFNELVEKEQR